MARKQSSKTKRSAQTGKNALLNAPNAERAATDFSPDSAVAPPASAGPAAREVSDPNFTAATAPRTENGKTGSFDEPRGQTRNQQGGKHGPQLVRDVMTSEVECCEPSSDLQYAARMMLDHDCGAIPVVDDTHAMHPVGIITDRDIAVRVVAKGQDPYGLRVSDCMSAKILTVYPDTPIDQCIHLMEDRKVRRVPVIDRSGRLCGIVAQADLARAAPQLEAVELLQEVSQLSDQGHGAHH